MKKKQNNWVNQFSRTMIGMVIAFGIIGVLIVFCGDAIAETMNTTPDTMVTETVTITSTVTTTTSVTTATDVTTTTTSVSTTTTSTTETEITTPETTTTTLETYETEPYIAQVQEEEIEEYDYLFYAPSMRVHTPDCYYADESCMEAIYGDYIYNARKCTVCNPDITIDIEYIPEDEISYDESSSYGGYDESLTQNWTINEMTYYSGPWGCYGAAGTTLINNYSCACNSVPLGTILYIQSEDGSVDGYYRVDDRGGMGDNVVDIFYSDYSYTPSSFQQLGRVSCSVWVVG